VVGIEIRPAAFLELLFGLVADAGTASSADRATDDSTGRSSDRTADRRTGGTATERARAGAGLIVSLGRLAGDRATDSAHGTANHGARRATDCRADCRARQGTAAGAERLGAALTAVVAVVIDRVAAIHRTVHVSAIEVRVERVDVCVDTPRVIPVHGVAS
jgi:hypothetical protein